MLQKIDYSMWVRKVFRVKLASNFKWHFYGRRFTDLAIACFPKRDDLYRNKKTKDYCVGYWVYASLNSIDDALYQAWKFCETAEEAQKTLKYCKTFLSKMPRYGITKEYFDEYFKGYDIQVN